MAKKRNTIKEIYYAQGFLHGFSHGWDMYPNELDEEVEQEIKDVINKKEWVELPWIINDEDRESQLFSEGSENVWKPFELQEHIGRLIDKLDAEGYEFMYHNCISSIRRKRNG
tara:strand:+ start:247 stop:585 length:339 start_codon:yes stop_codon:yes gene_type:complete